MKFVLRCKIHATYDTSNWIPVGCRITDNIALGSGQAIISDLVTRPFESKVKFVFPLHKCFKSSINLTTGPKYCLITPWKLQSVSTSHQRSLFGCFGSKSEVGGRKSRPIVYSEVQNYLKEVVWIVPPYFLTQPLRQKCALQSKYSSRHRLRSTERVRWPPCTYFKWNPGNFDTKDLWTWSCFVCPYDPTKCWIW